MRAYVSTMWFLVLLTVSAAGCTQADPEPVLSSTTPVAPTPEPTQTVSHTESPAATSTVLPTQAPLPIPTAVPTPTPIPAPVASITFKASSEQAPVSVTFLDDSRGEILNWHWDFGDGFTSTEQSPTHIYERTGNYGVELTVSGPGGLDTASGPQLIEVVAGSIVEVKLDAMGVVLKPEESQELVLIASDEFGNENLSVEYEWSEVDQGVAVDQLGKVTADVRAGQYAIEVKAIDEFGSTISAILDVTVEPGDMTDLEVLPGDTEMEVGSETRFTVVVVDKYGNEIEDALIHWSSASAVGRIDGDGVYSAGNTAGSFENAVSLDTVRGSERLSGSWSVTLTHGIAASISVLPSWVVVRDDSSHQFSADVVDAYGNEITGLEVLWTTSVGQIDQTGTFLPPSGQGGIASINAAVVDNGGQLLGRGEAITPPVSYLLSDALGIARNLPAATLLPNGDVLISGGNHSDEYAVEIYRDEIRTFDLVSGTNCSQKGHRAAQPVLLQDGQVLMLGGAMTPTCMRYLIPTMRRLPRWVV